MNTFGSTKEWTYTLPLRSPIVTRSRSREENDSLEAHGENLGGELDEVKLKKRKREDDEPKKRNAKIPADWKYSKKKMKSTHTNKKKAKSTRKRAETPPGAKKPDHNKKGPTKKQLKDDFDSSKLADTN
jgi:hypothetical protein